MKTLRNIVVLLSCTLLCACTVEKKVVIHNADPDKTFIQAEFMIKDKLPRATVSFDMDTRYIEVTDPGNSDYPSSIQLKFSRQAGDTALAISADGDEQQLNNLYYLLNRNLVETVLTTVGR